MAEVGHLSLARFALQVSQAVLPRYRSRLSKHQFNQPQLLAILWLMRYEDGTFREAEVRLGEHASCARRWGWCACPIARLCIAFCNAWTTKPSIERSARRCADRATRAEKDGGELAQRRCGGLGAWSAQHVLCAAHASSSTETFAVAALAEVGGRRGFCVVPTRRHLPWNDCPNLPAVVGATYEQTRTGLALADAEFDSERNHTYICRTLGAHDVIPVKRDKGTWRIDGVRAEIRHSFPRRLYRRRTLIKSVFSSVKRKLSARAPGRSLRIQVRQALLPG